MTFEQQEEFSIRCEWGEQGVCQLAPISDVVIIVDVLSFSTCISIACMREATVFPYRWKDESRITFARSINAELAEERGKGMYSLSPTSLIEIQAGVRLVLPSPNGSTLSLLTGNTTTLAGCLRNAASVARAAMSFGRKIAVIPAGEKWRSDNSLRFALEDFIGAGAIISNLKGALSPEAHLALAAFQHVQGSLATTLKGCSSGKELIEKGFERDVALSAELDADDGSPLLKNGAFRRWSRPT